MIIHYLEARVPKPLFVIGYLLVFHSVNRQVILLSEGFKFVLSIYSFDKKKKKN